MIYHLKGLDVFINHINKPEGNFDFEKVYFNYMYVVVFMYVY